MTAWFFIALRDAFWQQSIGMLSVLYQREFGSLVLAVLRD